VLKVTKTRVLAVLAGSLLAISLLGAAAMAQPGTATPASSASRFRSDIALVDVGYIFKNHDRFKQYMADLQADMERADAVMKKERDSLKQLQDSLSQYNAGSKEYKDLEERIVGKLADFNARVTLQRKEFLVNEAKIYHMIYQQIQDEVKAFAQENNVLAVLRFNSELPDVQKPDEVARGLNNQVVWHHPNLDITKYILDNLKRRAGGTTTGARDPNYRFPR
jgi:Skp family chaperone for outer membrane proteins